MTVVGMEKVPFERVLGEEVGAFMKKLHEANGIAFKVRRAASDVANLKIAGVYDKRVQGR